MRMEGQLAVKISVREFSTRHTMVVVDCGDEDILEVDVLTRGGARIDFATRTVSLEWLVVPLKLEDIKECRRVSLAEGTVVCAGHRSLDKGKTAGRTRKEPWMVELLAETSEKKDLLVARTLTCCGCETVPVEVMNLTADDVYLYKGMHVAVASTVLEVVEENALSKSSQQAGRAGRLRTEEASKVLPDGVEEMVQEVMYPMT